MKCLNCGYQIEEGHKFCSNCRQPVKSAGLICAKCGHEHKEDAHFCGHCGNPLDTKGKLQQSTPYPADTPEVTPVLQNRTGEFKGLRSHATMLFADVKGSTTLLEGLDPEEARNMMTPVLNEMM